VWGIYTYAYEQGELRGEERRGEERRGEKRREEVRGRTDVPLHHPPFKVWCHDVRRPPGGFQVCSSERD
jgi:hypothetical protein